MSKTFALWRPIVLSFDFVRFDSDFADAPTSWWNCSDMKIMHPFDPINPHLIGTPCTLRIRGRSYKAVIRSITTEVEDQSIPVQGELAHRYLSEEPETNLDVMILEDSCPGYLDIPGLMVDFEWKGSR